MVTWRYNSPLYLRYPAGIDRDAIPFQTCPHVSGLPLNPQLFLSRFKIPRSHASVFQSNLPVHTYRDSLCYPGFLWEYWQQSMRRGCHLEYSIHDKEVGSILLRHRIKISVISVTWFRIHSVFKNFHSVLKDKHEVQQWNVNVSSSKKVRRVSGNCAEN